MFATFVVSNWYYFLNAAGDIETQCHLAEMVGTIANTQDMQAFPLQLRLLFGRRGHTCNKENELESGKLR